MAKQSMICSSCGTTGIPQSDTPGSFLIELLLWCFFLLPGLIYSIWRLSARKQVCPSCKGSGMIPLNSPRGRKLAQELGQP